ncbi:MAG: hypothetical protein AAF802_30305 [Planctomycetota bacterium]
MSQPRVGETRCESIPWDEIAGLLADAQNPIVQLGSASLEQSKLICNLMLTHCVRVRLVEDASLAALRRAIARDGANSITLGDALRFSDLIVVLGRGADSVEVQKLLRSPTTETRHLKCVSTQQLSDWLGHLRDVGRPSDLPLLDRGFITWVVSEGAFERGDEIVSSELLLRLLRELQRPADDEETLYRSALLHFDRHLSLRTVYRWRFNSDIPVANGHPQISVGDTETLNGPLLLQIGGTDPGVNLANCFVPAATLGVDLAGTMIRGDGSVTLPMKATRKATWPDPIEVLARVLR